jgi:hypothetical protein
MKKTTFLSTIIVLLLVLIPDCLAAIGVRNSEIRGGHKNKSIRLFNGRNLDGWYTFLKERGRNKDPKSVFTVVNGMIRISGEEMGCITSEKEFGNYHLVVEFKWGEKTFDTREGKARDSGVLLHSVGMDGASSGIWMHSIECQVIEGGTGDFIVVGDGSEQFSLTGTVEPVKQPGTYVFKPGGEEVTLHEGRINWFGRDPDWQDVKGFRGKNDVEKPAGKWNRLECTANGSEISVILNGKLVNHAVRVHPSKGRIQIQSEGAEIFFRRIDMIPLVD